MMFAFATAVFSIACIQIVTSQCPQNCQNCSNTNQCLMCKFGNWGKDVSCKYPCSNNCTNSDCDDRGTCYSCVNGMYGPNCNQECRLCKNGECGLRECTLGCKDGYFQYGSGDYSFCYLCQDNCQQCLNGTYCTFCNTGYYINKYTHTTEPKRGVAICTTCHSNNVCDECSKLPKCLQCSISLGALACEHCIEGYMFDNHQCIKNITCPLNCLNGCTPDGVCTGCTDGRTGNECSYLCGGLCSKCLQFNQNICQACKIGFYTSTCGISCPLNCAAGLCDFNNGSCLNGCLSGFWGDKCELKCSDHCTQAKCNRLDGTCSVGCTSGYGTSYCNITTTSSSTTLSTSTLSSVISSTPIESSSRKIIIGNCQEGRSISGAVLGGAVMDAVVITALLVGSIAYFLHRRLVSKTGSKEQRTETMYYNTHVRSTANADASFNNFIKATEVGTNQTPEISVYDQLSRTNTEHLYTGL